MRAARDAVWRPPLGRPMTASDVMDAKEVSELLHIPQGTVEDHARSGLLPSQKVGRRRRYLRWEIEAWLTRGGANDVT